MSLTRTHLAFLGIIGVFTGIIGAGTSSGDIPLSYLMTSVRWLSYSILLALILAFILAALRKWALYRIFAGVIILSSLVLLGLTLTGDVEDMRTGSIATGLSWGWIFLFVGNILLGLTYRSLGSFESDTRFSDVIDTIIGLIGGFALACITGILILSSFSFFATSQNHDILSSIFGSGSIKIQDGITRYGLYESEPEILYARGKNALYIGENSEVGKIWKFILNGNTLTGKVRNDMTPHIFGRDIVFSNTGGYITTASGLILGSKLAKEENAYIYTEDGRISIVSDSGMRYLPLGEGYPDFPILVSRDTSTLLWSKVIGGRAWLMKNEEKLIDITDMNIRDITLSSDGTEYTLATQSGGTLWTLHRGAWTSLPTILEGDSYGSNGLHITYTISQDGKKRVYHDYEAVSKELLEVRDLMLEDDGASYTYFGRPIGSDTFCLYTRYRGSLCGIEAYMNPSQGADGGSIIFLARRNGVWSIYRNTERIIANTYYTPTDIRYDYAFYDTTNPRSYLIIERDPESGLYSYRKNGVKLPGEWHDISTKVVFGYDDHILTSAKDKEGWKIIEL